MRVPMVVYAPGSDARRFEGDPSRAQHRHRADHAGSRRAPQPGQDHGRPLRAGGVSRRSGPWDGEMVYEYYWEYAFPHTPTTLALRGDRYKFIYYPGVWDVQELYDLERDPKERHNLIDAPEHQERDPDRCGAGSGISSKRRRDVDAAPARHRATEPAQGRRLVSMRVRRAFIPFVALVLAARLRRRARPSRASPRARSVRRDSGAADVRVVLGHDEYRRTASCRIAGLTSTSRASPPSGSA